MSASNGGLVRRYGPAAVVTGASDGIGLAIARRLAVEGFDLVLVARRAARLEEVAAELRRECGRDVRTIAADMASPAGIGAVLDATINKDVGLLVAAAGFGTSGPFVDGRLDDELSMIDVNCRAVVALAQPFARRFVARRRGGIVLMSSLVAFQGVPRAAVYSATKAFVQNFAEALRIELAGASVDVLACAPGPVASGFAARARMTMGLAENTTAVARGTLAALGRRAVVRPGWLAKGLEASLSLLPRALRVRVMALVMAGMARQLNGNDKSAAVRQ